jgi:multimeric flavodoxin WrbA
MVGPVIGISGSPREDGNTDVAVKAALEEVAASGVETEFVRIYQHEIRSCKGCRNCMRLGHCVIQDDDLEDLLGLLRQSPGAVLGAPVYWDGPPGRMKDFIDRSHGYYASEAGTLLSDLSFSLISVATASAFEPHDDVMLSWIEYYGATLAAKERIYAREKGDLPSRPGEMQKARRAGRVLLEAIRG